jgi:DMSO/TMAO reductase YedYZ molybdopterin-dependent catalytic subunit
MSPRSLSRRAFLNAGLLFPAAFAQTSSARFIATVPLGEPGRAAPPPFDRLLGAGLDARQFTDLSLLGESAISQSPIPNPQSAIPNQSAIRDPQSALVTSTERFFIRTAAPGRLPAPDGWMLRVGGLVQEPVDVAVSTLESAAGTSGRYLIECSGNSDQSNYGLMSAADWEGVPLTTILDRVRPSAAAYRVLVSGVDDEASRPVTSIPGASWIFSRGDLGRAMLATRMNGAPLTRDHGAPVRLIVPGWYGCACIKWVDRIELVEDEARATTQMREFAARTHQAADAVRSEAPLARDFIPAAIDTAAMPVRAEKWAIDGRIVYRLAGIVWGGSKPTNALQIRFRSGQQWVPVDDCPMPASTLTWSLWTHTWRPEAPGRYQIVLRVNDPAIRTRRLDVFFYVREIEIDDV